MTDHQQRLWQIMINLIQSYLQGKTEDFYGLVGELEGGLDASEIKDDILIKQWYDFWTPLEIRRAIEGNNINKEKAIDELINMKEFLLRKMDIKIEIQGRIIEGELKDWYVFVQDDTENIGGYSIMLRASLEPTDPGEFDAWVENFQSLQEYFQKRKWQIQWLDSEASHA